MGENSQEASDPLGIRETSERVGPGEPATAAKRVGAERPPASAAHNGSEGREDPERGRQRFEGLVPDLIRKAVEAGLGAFGASEEGFRRFTGEFSLPKELAGYLVAQAQTTKSEVLRIVSRELRQFLDGLRLDEELRRALGEMKLEMKTEIRFVPRDKAGPRSK